MKNELSGYIKESLISILPRVFSGIATNAFVFEDFIRRVEEQKLKESIDETDLKQLLLILFEAGYIGHLVEGRGGKVSVLFKYRNPSVTIDYSQRFLIHRGIQKGLGVKL